MARYTDSLLMDGEHVLYRTRQHPLGRIVAARWGIVMVGVAIAALVAIFIGNPGDPLRGILGWVTLVLLVLGAVDIVWIYLHWWAEDYVITNRRILKVEGLFNKRAADSSLEKINDAILEQSVFGRIFDWGDLKVLTAAEENADDYHLLHHAPTFKKTMLLAKQDIEDELARRITAPLEALNARESEQGRREAEAQASAGTAPPPPVAAPAPVQKTAEEKLRELAALRDAGLITPEDFEAKKTTILATM
ncbi:MAG TPA: PH domain-containing protein [Candidatus Limnocylindrales bacterium]|jgi:uncharacterized membrane protein YdbT with pleckstrin-like domain